MARKHEFSVDMHVHSMYSGESLSDPRDVVEVALERGLDGICVTEHESLSASAPFELLRRRTRLVILRGVELSTDVGHMLVYGVNNDDWMDWGKGRICHAEDLVDRVHKLGGVVVPAHPYVIKSSGNGEPSCCSSAPRIDVNERALSVPGIAALEVCNGKHQKYPVVSEILGYIAKNMNLPGTGGSDAHIPEDVGRAYTVFKTPVLSNRDLVRAVQSGALHPMNHTAYPRVAAANISAH